MKISDIIIFDQCTDSYVAIVSVLLNMINYFHGEYRGIRKNFWFKTIQSIFLAFRKFKREIFMALSIKKSLRIKSVDQLVFNILKIRNRF